MQSLRIIIVGLNYLPEKVGNAVYTGGLADYLAAKGHQVDVIAAVPHYPQWKVQEGWPRAGYVRCAPRRRLRVVHCPLYVPRQPSGLKRILHGASFALSAVPPLLLRACRRRPDIVIVMAPSLLSTLAVLPLAFFARAKTWLHIQDFEVEAAFSTNLLRSRGPLAKLATDFERWALRRYDRVSSISTPMVKRLCDKEVELERVREFRNWADPCVQAQESANKRLKAELGVSTRFVALYAGSLSNKQGAEILAKAALKLEHRDDLTFLICGDGPNRASLGRECNGLANVRFLPLQAKSKLNDLLSIADVHLLPQIGEASELFLPSKLANMLASGRPVIATARPGTALEKELTDCGLITPPGDAKALAHTLDALLDAPERRAALGLAARNRAESHWAQQAILDHFELELRALVLPPSAESIDPVAITT